MVSKLIGLVNREVSNIHDAAYFLAFFTFISQLLGLIRDRMLTHFFGASASLDIYYASFRIPDFIFILVGSFISVSIVIPFLQEKIVEGKEKAKQFVDSLFTIFFLLIITASVAAFLLMPYLAKILFATMPASSLSEIIYLSRILLLSPILMGVSNLFASITQVNKRFILYAMCPIVYNLAIVLGIVFLQPMFGLEGVIMGVLFGAFLHALIQIPYVRKSGLMPDVVLPVKFKVIKEVFKVSVPRTIALVSGSIAMIGLVAMASRMTTGSISIFNLAQNLQSVPLVIIGLSYSMAAFPTLAKLFSQGEKQKFIDTIALSVKHVIFLSLPVVALFVVLRAQIVRVVLGSGNFTWSDTKLTAACLAIFAISAVAQSLCMLFVRAYYAIGSTKKPLFINVFSSVLILVFPLIFIVLFDKFPGFLHFLEFLFKIPDVAGTEVIALPLGFSIATIINVVLFFFIFERDFKKFWCEIKTPLFQSFSASVLVGFGAYIGLNIFDNFFNLDRLSGVFFQGLLAGILGLAVGAVVLHILGSKELVEVGKTLHRRVWKAKEVVVPDQMEIK